MVTLTKSTEKNLALAPTRAIETDSNYYGSDIYDKLGYKSKEDFELTLPDTFDTFYSNRLSVKENFKQVFRFNHGKMYTDWKISSIAFNFLKANSTVSSEEEQLKKY